jgi:ABC-type glycerol-3-phosphate transport system substrate-binding protein
MKQERQHVTGLTGRSRRGALWLGATAVAGAAVGPFVMRVSGAADAFSWQRFKGSKIFLQFSKNPWAETMEKLLPDFEKQSGIKAEFATLPEIQARQKLTVEFTGGLAVSMPGTPVCTWRSAGSGSPDGTSTSATSFRR